MKKLWKKFKCWLIKKLGGYAAETRGVEHYTLRPICIESQVTDVNLDRYREDPTFKEYIDKMLICHFSDYLYEHREQLVRVVESSPNFGKFPTATIDLKATINVHPKS